MRESEHRYPMRQEGEDENRRIKRKMRTGRKGVERSIKKEVEEGKEGEREEKEKEDEKAEERREGERREEEAMVLALCSPVPSMLPAQSCLGPKAPGW